MAGNIGDKITCLKCGSTKAPVNFYTLRNGEKHPMCKDCLTLHMNMYEPESFTWALRDMDLPYIEHEWKKVRAKEFEKALNKARTSGAGDPQAAAYKMTRGNPVVFGRYLSNCKLKQHKDHTWADSERLNKDAEIAKAERENNEEFLSKANQMKEMFARGEISEAEYMTWVDVNPDELNEKTLEDVYLENAGTTLSGEPGRSNGKSEDPAPVPSSPFVNVQMPDITTELEEQDMIYLTTKWGNLYSPSDWLYLERKYEDFLSSFDIKDAARKDTLIQICKLSLKMNNAIDINDTDSYSKFSRSYDTLMKSAKFTEAQKKEDKTTDFSGYGQIVAYCEEKTGFIPAYDISVERDIVDKDLQNIKDYTKSLIEEDPAIFKLIEQYIKKKEIISEQEKDREQGYQLSDSDMTDYNHFVEGGHEKNTKNEEEE